LTVVASQTAGEDGSSETYIRGLVTRREVPPLGLNVERNRGLEEVLTPTDDVCVASERTPNDVLKSVGRFEHCLAVLVERVFPLIEVVALSKYLEITVQLLVINGNGLRHPGEFGS
jgi:hypothetical protein